MKNLSNDKISIQIADHGAELVNLVISQNFTS